MRNMIPVIYIVQRELRRPRFWVCVAAAAAIMSLAAWMSRAKQDDTRRIPIAVVDEDGTEISGLVIERIKDNEFIELKTYGNPMKALMRWEIDGLFILREGFTERLINGEKKGLIDFYYPPVYVTPEIIGEAVAKEVMRIYVSYRASEFVRGEYGKRGMNFDETIENEMLAYTDSFWQKGDTITLDVHYISGGNPNSGQENGLKLLMVNAVLAAVLMFIYMIAGINLVSQKENGVFTKLSLCNVPHIPYSAASVLTLPAACLPALLFIPLAGKTTFAFYMLWCGLFTVFISYVVKRVNSYLLLMALSPILMTGFAGLSSYFGGVFSAVGFLNPIYCVMTGSAGLLMPHIFAAFFALGTARLFKLGKIKKT